MVSFKKLALIVIFTSCAVRATALQAGLNTDISTAGLAQKAVITAAIAGASYAVYKSYGFLQDYIDRLITEQIADHIVLALTPNSVAMSMSQEQQKEFQHKKARLINRRKRILEKLQAIDLTTLSKKHAEQLRSKIKLMKRLFLLIDGIRAVNPYENQYTAASYFDQYIENQIVERLIFAVKPQAECTPSQLHKKLVNAQKTKQIISLVAPRISAIYLVLLEQILDYRS